MAFYNERYLVAESVARVLAVGSALITRLDLIIVDDGSTDGTPDILRGLAEQHADRITYVEHQSNMGKGAAVTGRAFGRPTAGAFYISVSKLLTGLCDIDPSDEPLVAGEAGAGLSRGGGGAARVTQRENERSVHYGLDRL